MLLGYAGSTLLVHEGTAILSEDTPVKFDDYELVLVEYDEDVDHSYITIEVWKDGRLVGKARPGIKVLQGQTRSEVSVVRLVDRDLHFVLERWMETGEGTRAEVTVKVLPGISLLWGGVGMMATGTVLRFSPIGPPGRGRRDRPAPVKLRVPVREEE
jgi:cytochrome c biogenesis factor